LIRIALCLLLGGCTVVEHVQVLPTLSATEGIDCCVILAEPNPSTNLSLTITKPAQSLELKAGARWKF
jgi:hypothetical protein